MARVLLEAELLGVVDTGADEPWVAARERTFSTDEMEFDGIVLLHGAPGGVMALGTAGDVRITMGLLGSDRAARSTEQHQDDRPDQRQPQRTHEVPPSIRAGRVRQWLGAVQGGHGVGRVSSPPACVYSPPGVGGVLRTLEK